MIGEVISIIYLVIVIIIVVLLLLNKKVTWGFRIIFIIKKEEFEIFSHSKTSLPAKQTDCHAHFFLWMAISGRGFLSDKHVKVHL